MDTIRIIHRLSGALASMLFAALLAGCDDAATSDASVRDASDARADGAADAETSPRDADVPDAMRDAAATETDAGAGTSDKCDRLDEPFDRIGDDGIVVARFVSIDPALEYKGYYDWTLELRERSGKAIGDAELEADAEMPAHGHGTTPITLKHEPAAPRYELREVNLFIKGRSKGDGPR